MVRGAFGACYTGASRLFYFFCFLLRPGFKVPLNWRPRSISALVHSLMLTRPTFSSFGAGMLLLSIHAWSVCRETPICFAASPVE